MAEQPTQATHQRAHRCLPRLVYERNMLLSCLSLWVRGLLCKSCLTFSLMNVSSFSCFKHKALTPNVINPRKPGQYLTGKDFIPTRLCSFVLKISEQGLSFNALSHCTGGTCPEQTTAHGTDVYWIMHCFFIEEAQPNITSEAEVSRRHIMSSASGTENSISKKPQILHTTQSSPPDWSMSQSCDDRLPPTQRRQNQVLNWHGTKTSFSQRQSLTVWESKKSPLHTAGMELKPVHPAPQPSPPGLPCPLI